MDIWDGGRNGRGSSVSAVGVGVCEEDGMEMCR